MHLNRRDLTLGFPERKLTLSIIGLLICSKNMTSRDLEDGAQRGNLAVLIPDSVPSEVVVPQIFASPYGILIIILELALGQGSVSQ